MEYNPIAINEVLAYSFQTNISGTQRQCRGPSSTLGYRGQATGPGTTPDDTLTGTSIGSGTTLTWRQLGSRFARRPAIAARPYNGQLRPLTPAGTAVSVTAIPLNREAFGAITGPWHEPGTP